MTVFLFRSLTLIKKSISSNICVPPPPLFNSDVPAFFLNFQFGQQRFIIIIIIIVILLSRTNTDAPFNSNTNKKTTHLEQGLRTFWKFSSRYIHIYMLNFCCCCNCCSIRIVICRCSREDKSENVCFSSIKLIY